MSNDEGMTKSEWAWKPSRPVLVISAFGFPSSFVIRASAFPSSQSAQEQFGVRLRGLQIVEQFFHRLERWKGRHRFAQHQHALPFIGMIKQLLASGGGLQRVDCRIKSFLL